MHQICDILLFRINCTTIFSYIYNIWYISFFSVVEKAKVQFDYDAQNPDELSLKEGDIIIITSKEAGDSGWWEGEINGKKGVFPDNFVTLLPPEVCGISRLVSLNTNLKGGAALKLTIN